MTADLALQQLGDALPSDATAQSASSAPGSRRSAIHQLASDRFLDFGFDQVSIDIEEGRGRSGAAAVAPLPSAELG